jgi:hypothetical protein
MHASPVIPSASFPAFWFPPLGILLAGLGVLLLHAAMRETVPSVLPPGTTSQRAWAAEATTDLAEPLSAMTTSYPSDGLPGWCAPCARRDTATPPLPTVVGPHVMLFDVPTRKRTVSLRVSETRNRGKNRRFLEQTAALRWTVPGNRVIMAWDEASGYGAAEDSRAAHAAPVN